MKLILYMGISINGYIAKEDGDSQWTSDEDLAGFYEHSKKAGNIIMGRNTFQSAADYKYFPFPDALNVVVTYRPLENKWGEKVVITDKSPKEILEMLERKGFNEAFIAGGGKLNASFMKEGLIDEIYLDVEPLIFGKGIQIFAAEDFEYELELLEVKKLGEQTVQLHYKVKK